MLVPAAMHAEDAGLPMTLAAGKSSIGHTEPAAGLAGIFHALHTMQSSLVQPILHFRQVYIAADPPPKSERHRDIWLSDEY